MDNPLATINISKIAEDIYKNLHEKGIVKTQNYPHEIEDIRQEVICITLELQALHPDKFPCADGYIYTYAYFKCLRLYRGNLIDSKIRLSYVPPDDVLSVLCRDRLPPDLAYEEACDEAERQKKRRCIRTWLDRYGVDIDDALGLDFALWWQGVTIEDISQALKKANLKGYPHSPHSVLNRLNAAYSELERKTGITREQLFQCRKLALWGKV
jgi:hypothetical protein